MNWVETKPHSSGPRGDSRYGRRLRTKAPWEVNMKRLVVCCDGTWNRPDQTKQDVAAPTNVAKISLALAEEDDAGNSQLLHYEPGVGTRRGERILGGGFGV